MLGQILFFMTYKHIDRHKHTRAVSRLNLPYFQMEQNQGNRGNNWYKGNTCILHKGVFKKKKGIIYKK